ncbi:MAG: MFS transporter [Propionibacteriales bacterium]|nr:MFS transporter [Propionibacteriales bacterium]
MTTSLQRSGQDETSHGHRHLGAALTVISMAQLMVVLDSTIANIAIPYMAHDLHFSKANQSWIITGYTLAFGGLLLLGGRLGDLFGRRKIFMLGVLLFALASLLGGVAQTQETLLAARGLQGLGAAIASPTALALITTTFPAGKERNRAFAVYAAMSGAGAAVGLILGGWLTEYSWRWTFLINVPIGIAAAVLAPMVLGESARRRLALDLPGAATGTLGLLALVYGLTRAADSSHGWTDTWTIAALGAGAALLVSFVVIEGAVREPLMPLRILADRTRGVSFLVMMLVPAAMFSMFYFLSIVVQNGMGYTSLRTGFAFLPFSIGIVVSAGIASSLMSRIDPRWLAGIGTALAGVGLFGFSRLPYSDGSASVQDLQSLGVHASYATDLLPWIVIMSFGMGFVFVPLTLTAVHGVDSDDSGIGSGVLNAMQQVGGSLGLAALSTVAVHATTAKANEIIAGAQANATQLPQQSSAAQQSFRDTVVNVAFAHGSTQAFIVGAGMIWAGSVIAFLFLNVSHEEINDTAAPTGALVA